MKFCAIGLKFLFLKNKNEDLKLIRFEDMTILDKILKFPEKTRKSVVAPVSD